MAALLFYIASAPQIDAVMKTMYVVLFTGLFYCCLVYQINRFGAARRRAGLCTDSEPAELDRGVTTSQPAITVLIPSYREERRVLLMTVLSAALARYSNRSIVVLVDDPPGDPDRHHTLRTISEARELLSAPMDMLAKEHTAWLDRRDEMTDLSDEPERLACLFETASAFLDDLAARLEAESEPAFAHVDGFFIDAVVGRLARRYGDEAARLRAATLDRQAIERVYAELATLFCCDITAFERKQYENLPHAPNKAMNLNAYIGLMGRWLRPSRTRFRTILVTSHPDANGAFEVPQTPYVLTLDADSIILPDYMQELMAIIESDDTIGVVQTPYRAFPGSAALVERVAGATTDIQYLVHQGSSHFRAAFWVGANALLRTEALDRIATQQRERGHTHRVFIQDQTVIEDTGSTIDLLRHGWHVHNHFKPLAYSATPADFGALAVQRQRWSNGGLIIFPQLWRQLTATRAGFGRVLEGLLRTHYLLSPVIGNTTIFLLMLMVSVDARHLLWMPVAMAPYFVLYGLDLRQCGYRFRDVFAVCALNLMLLPVGLAGVFGSLMQMATGKKGTFWRTPKVAGRTSVHWAYIVFNVAMLALMVHYFVQGLVAQKWVESIFPATNMALYGYGLWRFIGLRNGLVDLCMAVVTLLCPVVDSVRWVGWHAAHTLPRRAGVLALGVFAAIVPVSFGTAVSSSQLSEPPALSAVEVAPGLDRVVTSSLGSSFSLAPSSAQLALWHESLTAEHNAPTRFWLVVDGRTLEFSAPQAVSRAMVAGSTAGPGRAGEPNRNAAGRVYLPALPPPVLPASGGISS